MAKKPTIVTVATGYQSADVINSNFTDLRDAFDNTLSLDGSTPNALEADLDLNNNDILNVNTLEANNIVLSGAPLPIANGGTGATTAAGARTNLGLGTLATQSGTFSGTHSGTTSGTNTGDQNTFSTIAVSGQDSVTADGGTDTLNLVAGTGITITTNAATDSITITNTGGGGGGGGGGTIDLATDVTGVLAVSNGGTGASTAANARTSLGAAGTGVINSFVSGQTVGNGSNSSYINIAGGDANHKLLIYSTAGASRWSVGTDNIGSSGTKTGDNFSLYSYDNSGNYSENPLNVNRETGITYLKGLGLTNDLAVADGGTGSSTAAGARANLKLDNAVTPEQYGAVGDGSTDDRTAVVDALATGKTVIMANTYRIGSALSITSGTMVFIGNGKLKPSSSVVITLGSAVTVGGTTAQCFDTSAGGSFNTASANNTRGPSLKISNYIPSDLSSTAQDAGFEQALKDLFNLNYYSLDLEGRMITLTRSINVYNITGVATNTIWKKLSNGRINLHSSFSTNSPTSTGTKSATLVKGSETITVGSTTGLSVGMEITGTGIPICSFIVSIPNSTTFTISNKVYTAGAGVTISWKKHAFALDFSGMDRLTKFTFENIYWDLNNLGSGYFGSKSDDIVECNACRFENPESFAWAQPKEGGGTVIINSDFGSGQSATLPTSRTRIGIVIGGDSRVYNNRWAYFKHSAVFTGGSVQFIGNHPFAGYTGGLAAKTAGIVYQQYVRGLFTGNYIDNGWLELRNETFAYNANADVGGLTICDNFWTSTRQPVTTESFIVVAPYTTDSTLKDITIANNIFRPLTDDGGLKMDYATKIDTTYGTVDGTTIVNCFMHDNAYDGRETGSNINYMQGSPLTLKIAPNSGVYSEVDFGSTLMFKISPKNVTNITTYGTKSLGTVRPLGVAGDKVKLIWDNEASSDTEIHVSAGINTNVDNTTASRLTSYTPATATTDTVLNSIEGWGYNGTDFVKGGEVRLAANSGSSGNTYIPTKYEIYLAPSGSNAPTRAFHLSKDGNATFYGPVFTPQAAATSKAGAATLTGAELMNGILQYTGGAATITLPSGTDIEAATAWLKTGIAIDWYVINTGSGTCTIAANGNNTVGTLTVSANNSAHFRVRRSGTNIFWFYRVA